MRSKVIAVALLLAVSGAPQLAALAMPPSHQAVVAYRHGEMAKHACCPRSSQERPTPPPAQTPNTNAHRCCFLRGPQSSLPTSAALKEQLVLDRNMAREAPGSTACRFARLARNTGQLGLVPPFPIQMSVVLRN
jgi:hypothetical protein